ncbi:hypothetical protein AMTRI_Chr04g184330 [Amborella trichopoda]
MDNHRTCFGSRFFYFYKNHPPPILLSSLKLNFFPLTSSSPFFIFFPLFLQAFITPIFRLSWLLRRTTQSPRARGRFSSGLSTEERRRIPSFFLGLGTSLKVCPLISHRAFDPVMFSDTSITFLSSDPGSKIGFFPLNSGPSSWPFWHQF